ISYGPRRTPGVSDIWRSQNSIFRPNCTFLGPTFIVLVTTPNVVLPNAVSGQLNWGVFVRLNASARNCARMRSLLRKFLATEMSRFFCLSARSSLIRRGELPTVYGAGAENAAVLNQRSGVRFSTDTSLAFVRLGYCVPKPYWLIVLGAVSRTGRPLDSLATPD